MRQAWLRPGAHVAAAVLLAGCAHRGVPAMYPDLDHDTAPARLAIVEVIASDYLPRFPECMKPDVLCMDPAPTWIKLKTLQTLNGDAFPRTFHASTTSHYGKMTQHGSVQGPQLMLLLGEGDDIVMARYSRAPLTMDGSRRFHLVLHDRGPRWLPCAVESLRDPITDPSLVRASAVPRAHFDDVRRDDAEAHYRIEVDHAFPRYSLPIEKLEEYLGGRTLTAAAMRCQRDGD